MRSANTLGKYLRTHLHPIISELGEIELKEIFRDDGLKSNILEDPLYSVTSVSGTSFRIDANPKDIAKSILRDFLLGVERLQKQWESTLLIADRGFAAWALVSSYYCSFYCAIESLRICGTCSVNLTGEEADLLFTRVGGPHLASLKTRRSFRGSISPNLSSIGFVSTEEKPHQLVWRLFGEKVLPIVPSSEMAAPEIAKFSGICLGKSGWEFPSDIRNRWNYRDPAYFGELGRSACNPFLGLLKKDGADASSWIRSKVGVRTESDAAASIAALTRLLHLAVCDTLKYGINSAKNLIR